MNSPITLGVVADDLTGANDTAVQFARRGWAALLVLDAGSRTSFDDHRQMRPLTVLAVTTDSRALPNEAAERLTSGAVAQLVRAGIDRLYLKIDSTMRGSIPGQIAGALKAWQVKCPGAGAVVCPAYPRMQRAVVDNQLMVDGGRVEHSAIGRDPVTPVKTSDLGQLIPGSTHVGTDQVAAHAGRVTTVDAREDRDLAAIASAIGAMGASAVPVGSAGLADAMAAVWGGIAAATRLPDVARVSTDRILIQMTSLNPASHAQVDRLASVHPEVVVLSGPAEEVSLTFADRFRSGSWDLVGLIGGDGARAALRRLGASAIRIAGSPVEGIPIGVIVGGEADRAAVFTKAGGFGAPDALVRLVESVKK